MPAVSAKRLSDAAAVDASERPRRVGVTVNNMGGYSRGVLRGIASFAFARAWECRVEGVNAAGGLDSPAECDGWIVQALAPDTAADLHRAGLPVVNISSARGDAELPSVVPDDVAIGRLGGEHFLRQGFRSFAFFSPVKRDFARLRHEGFANRLAEGRFESTLVTTEAELDELLFTAERPLAVMATNDSAALVVLDRCRHHRLKVPDEVAVLGVDNDDLIQSLAFPPLSSIAIPTDRIGFEAAALLDRFLSGQPVVQLRTLVPPTGVVTRRSTDVLAIDDADVAEALRFIRDRAAGTPIGVDDVARSVVLSRRQLERRFRAALGRSVLDEIGRVRTDRAKQLLAETELTIAQVAIACGFSSASYFTIAFGRATGGPPGEYRRAAKARG